ncbi:MAG: prepilin-type N-terminal cleavage/methylation domain-containing protein [Rubrivivax sp.]|nr:prepilin-type N-terminal cleavage/methylation domain-containing protein [Rubrivivax sp.]
MNVFKSSRQRQRGVSLIEAMVALLVMGFGALALVGVQASLRLNGDIAKQRAEAVRIAQASIERWRGFSELSGDVATEDYYSEIADDARDVDGVNATFSVVETVVTSTDPSFKTFTVDVTWTDRTDQTQRVQLSTAIVGVPSTLAATLSISTKSSPLGMPGNRHPAIPRDALTQEDGTSVFTPPGAGTTSWVFDNSTGVITKICSDDELTNCIAVNARLLAGFIRFATTTAAPTAEDSEIPPGSNLGGLQVVVNQTSPLADVGTVQCFEDTTVGAYVPYFCAVPDTGGLGWAGQSVIEGFPVDGVTNLPLLAASISDASSNRYRVCRYTTRRDHSIAPTQMPNGEHPLNYASVGEPLINQNFLVIRAGNGGTAFGCPDDDVDTPLNGRTWHHQPST